MPRFALILPVCALFFGLTTGAGAACVTASCHPQLGKGRVVHQPVADGECTACHQATGKPHPGKGSMTLSGKDRDLCLACHDDPAAGQPHLHPPVAAGCVACHLPHQSNYQGLLKQGGGVLCLACHPQVVAGSQVHGPVRAGNCALCHAPHAGPDRALLLQGGNAVCLGCHADIAKTIAEAKSQHDPVVNGRCWECHTPHASDQKPLLRAAYPTEFYAPYRAETYALCFTCHPRETVEFDLTSEATSFRNRSQNLHFLHVMRDGKGRACKSCHGVHGADQGKLLLSRIEHFGRWGIPLRWERQENGATCYVGCHRPKAYNRVTRENNL